MAPGPAGKAKILCVDDEPILTELCEERLRDMGYEVIGESDAGRALRLFEEDPDAFDLLIVDQVMPTVTGTELAKKAVAIRPGINVLLIVGHEGAVSAEEARNAGVREVIAKPLTNLELGAAIRRILT